ncbi:MAG: hypothetical protein EOS12_31265 [Mesorhizobium sp.]|nr:MAG: hypothetical protein EOS12_31265 [Mesorhizobium sp.]
MTEGELDSDLANRLSATSAIGAAACNFQRREHASGPSTPTLSSLPSFQLPAIKVSSGRVAVVGAAVVGQVLRGRWRLSSIKDERLVAEKAHGGGDGKISGDRDALFGDLELALFAGMIATYAQGFT